MSMEKLVTKDLLKAFGDKSKKIFKPATAVISIEDALAGDILIVPTDINYNTAWNINIGVDCVSLTDTFEDIKFIGNACLTDLGVLGKGVSFGNEIVGVSFYLDLNSGNLSLLFSFNIKVVSASVTIVNRTGPDTSNVIISNMQILDSINTLQDLPIALENTLGVVIDQSGNEYEGNVGKIVNLGSSELSFYMKVPGDYTSDISGVKTKVTNDDYIPKVNNSKWADYVLMPYNILFEEGDLEAFAVYFGGNIYTTKRLTGPKINNSVTGYEGYQEGDLVGRVKVNSKGLVTAVEKDPELPKATETTLGVVLVGYKENLIDKLYPVKLDADGNAYVHVPWNDTDTWNKVATESDLGLIKLGFKKDGKKYPVELNSDNKAYVEVPWTDTITEIPVASETTSGTIKLGYEENDKNYPIEVNDQGQAFVNVPWESGENGTYDIATADTAGLIKVGLNSNVWWENAVKLDVNGNAYVNVGTPVYTSNVKGSNITKEFSYGFDDYEYTIIDPASTSKSTIDIVLRTLNGWEFKGVLNKIHRISNQSLYTATIKVSNNTDTTLCNMFDAQITSADGLELPAGKTLELVFTFWDVNDVSFNGGFSV